MDVRTTVILCSTRDSEIRRMVIYKIIPEAGRFALVVTPLDFAPEKPVRFLTLEAARNYVQNSVDTFQLEIISDEQETSDDCGCTDSP